MLVNLCACLFFLSAQAAAAVGAAGGAANSVHPGKNILFINSYGYDFETVPVIVNQIERAFKQTASVQYLFMNEKYVDSKVAEQRLSVELDHLSPGFKYDVVILGDDAAFDYAMAHRDRYFKGIPLVYENINSIEKAQKYQNDPLISGVVEEFPVKETIALAQKMQKQAKKIVIITDNSPSGAGSARQYLNHEKDFPELSFVVFDCSQKTGSEIQRDIAAFNDDTILIYTVFNVDKEGKRYTMAQGVKLITDAAQIPVYKADEAGMGDGLLGGRQLSYAGIGKATVALVQQVLAGKRSLGSYQKGQELYQFDKQVMNRFGITKADLPKDSHYLNDDPTFYELYKKPLWTAGLILLLLIAALILKQKSYKRKIAANLSHLVAEQKANAAKTEFLSRMSHDIRTPLNGIMGMTYLASQQKNPPVTQDALAKIDASSHFLLTLINDILDMNKIESKKIVLHPEPVAFADFQKSIDLIILPLCRKKNITYTTKFSPAGSYTAVFDDLRLKQIYYNLLSNAAKYNKPGGSILLKITDKLSDDKKRIICDAEISDTGMGMSPEFLKVLFDPFTQEHHSDNLGESGTGLGLSIVKKMVGLMGGTISVKSQLGVGTTFYLHFELPCVLTSSLQPKKKAAETTKNLEVLQGQPVLVCDDQSINLEIAQKILERAGMLVTVAKNGKEAVEIFGRSSVGAFKAIILDIRMPIMGGLEAAKVIRSLKRPDAAKIPLIALSANAYDEDVEKSLAAGMNAHLSKPLVPAVLYNTLVDLTVNAPLSDSDQGQAPLLITKGASSWQKML